MDKKTIKRKTKDLPFVKRLLAQAISKLQQILISKDSRVAFNLYYLFAEVHFKLHYGYSLKNAIKCLSNPECAKAVRIAVEYAEKRHARLYMNANPSISGEGGKTVEYYTKMARLAFRHNLSA